jgi:hypothetical protein
MEDRLPRTLADVDDDTVIAQALARCNLGDEVEHPLRLVRRELRDLAEARDVSLGDDEQMRLGLRIDVADRDEPVRRGDMLAVGVERAEEAALVRQRESPPR